MTKNLLPDTDYFKISKAADIRGCEIDDIIHLAANQKTTLSLMLEEAECVVIIRSLTPTPPITDLDNFMEYQNRLVSAIAKITRGEFGLSQLSFNDVRPKERIDDVPMFYRFTYGGVTFPLTLIAKASGLWAVSYRFARHMERHGSVEMRPFFLKHGYVLNLENDIDGFQVSIVPVTSLEPAELPDACIPPEDLWLSHESMQQLLSKSGQKPTKLQTKPFNNNGRYSGKKHAMLGLLTLLLAEQDDTFAGIIFERHGLTSSNFDLLIIKLRDALQTPEAQPEELIQHLLHMCAKSLPAFLFLGSKRIKEWSNTAIAEEIQKQAALIDQNEIQSQLVNIDKNTIKNWLK